jgi:glycosyltransferase involved in cell wall biosynthesis
MASGQPIDPNPEPGRSRRGRRVLIDALAARFGGTGYATVHLARQLAHREDVSSVIVTTRAGSMVARGLADEPLVTCITLPARARMELLRRVTWEALCLPGAVASQEVDVVITMSGMLPRAPGSRIICLLFNPVMYERRTAANVVRRWAVRRTVRKADYVAAPSQAVADLASVSIGRRCEVVALGVDHEVFSPVDAPGEEILCVADFYRHKRHDVVLDAWLHLTSPRPRLRFIGSTAVDPRAHEELLARIHALPDGSPIEVESGVSLDLLVEAYRRARVFVLASEHESFCMPLAESMACGVPAVVRGLASLRETGGEGARYVEGDNPAAWAALMQELIDDRAAHQLARRAALAAATRFSWQTFAKTIAAHL